MSGLTAFLQTELLTLSSEARRKHPEIKEVKRKAYSIHRHGFINASFGFRQQKD